MKNVLILLSAVSILFITACNKKYTCAEAVLNCPGCRSTNMEFLEIPWTVVEDSLPLTCVLTLTLLPVNDISKGPDPKIDMQSMVAAYRSLNDRAHEVNKKFIEPCLKALEEQNTENKKAKDKYCKDRGYIYDPSRGVCTLKKP